MNPEHIPVTMEAPSEDGTRPLLVYFGHHKCASGWTTNIFREICFYMGRTFSVVHVPNHFEGGSLRTHVRRRRVEFLAYTNANIEHARDLSQHRAFHVVRDPRDILVSAYYSHRNTHGTQSWPALREHRKVLRAVPKEEGLFHEMEFSASFFEDMRTWDYDQEHVLELHMEDLTARPEQGFRRIVRFLGILDESTPSPSLTRKARLRMNRLNVKGRRFMPGSLPLFPVPRRPVDTIPAATIGRIIDRFRFSKLTGGRKRGEENPNSHYRKGEPGDWKNHFTDAHVAAFKDRYNDLLLKLGYESDPDWSR